jgi:hypothetical protein
MFGGSAQRFAVRGLALRAVTLGRAWTLLGSRREAARSQCPAIILVLVQDAVLGFAYSIPKLLLHFPSYNLFRHIYEPRQSALTDKSYQLLTLFFPPQLIPLGT